MDHLVTSNLPKSCIHHVLVHGIKFYLHKDKLIQGVFIKYTITLFTIIDEKLTINLKGK